MLKLENKTEGKSGGWGWGGGDCTGIASRRKVGKKQPRAKDQKLKCFELLNRNEAGRARAVPAYPLLLFRFPRLWLPKVSCRLEADAPPPDLSSEGPQKPKAVSRCLRRSPHFTSSRRRFLMSPHGKKKGEYNTIRYFETETTFTFAYSILL